MTQPPQTTRQVFADQLRGAAALLVVITHFTGVYWNDPALVAAVTFSPPQTGATPALAALAQQLPFNPGAFGVALFFLISGFVIPNAFTHHGGVTFLLARILRIWPCLIAATAIDLLALFASAHFWNLPFAVSPLRILTNILLVNNLTGYPTIDQVNWTLAIEIKFYLLFALARRPILRHPARWVLGTGAIAVLLCAAAPLVLAAAPAANLAHLLRNVALDVQYLPFMMVGTLFHLHWRGRLTTPQLTVLALATLSLVALSFRLVQIPIETTTLLPNYLAAAALFTLAYRLRRRIGVTPIAHFLAKISYPLYLIHAVPGYVLLKYLMLAKGWGYPSALTLTLAAILLVATLLHLAIERPSIAAGRRLGPDTPSTTAWRGKRQGRACAPKA